MQASRDLRFSLGRRSAASVAAIAVLGVAVAATGASAGSAPAASPSPAELIDASVAANVKVPSYWLDLKLRLTLTPAKRAQTPTPAESLLSLPPLRRVDISLAGPVVRRRAAARLQLVAQVSFLQVALTLTRIGDAVYLSIPGASYRLRLPDPLRAFLRSQPTLLRPEFLRWMAAAQKAGAAVEQGRRLTHLRGRVDPARVVSDLAVSLGTAASGMGIDVGPQGILSPVLAALRSARVDVWIAESDLLLQRVRARFDAAGLVLSGLPDGLSFSRVQADLDIRVSRFGERFTITAPGRPRTLDLDQLLSQGAASGG